MKSTNIEHPRVCVCEVNVESKQYLSNKKSYILPQCVRADIN